MKLKAALPLLCTCYLASVRGAAFVIPGDDELSLDGQSPNPGGGLLSKLGDPKSEALKAVAQEVDAEMEQRKARAAREDLEEAQKSLHRVKTMLQEEFDEAQPEASQYDNYTETKQKNGPEMLEFSTDDDSDKGYLEMDFETGDFDDVMKACDPSDCHKSYFWGETMRWLRKALEDIGVFILDNRWAILAFTIGAAVLATHLLTSGGLVPLALEAVGFGAKGPIGGSIASAIQSKLGVVQTGSIFAKLQAAAMTGAGTRELHMIANAAFSGLIASSAYKLVGAGRQPLGQSADFEPREWRDWLAESRFNYPPKSVNQMAHFWGAPTPEGCVAYGYREYRAPLWYVPPGKDPLRACVKTPATINGFGFRTPLGCVDEGPKKGVVGMWYLPTNETGCMPRWGTFEDEGCMLYGQRRKFARLFDLSRRDDWTGVCESTPAAIDGKEFDAPTYCEDKGIRGVFGVFDITDEQIVVIGCLAAGLMLANLGMRTLGQFRDIGRKEWVAWQAKSKTKFSSGEADKLANFWGKPTRQGCVAYGNRQYQAPILYVPKGKGALSVCASTPAAIHGVGFKTPLRCSDEGGNKGAVGTWYVPTKGGDCMPWWGEFEDRGCVRRGERRKFARLFGLSLRDNWMGVCKSTPATVNGENFASPSYCEDKGVWGIFGGFDFADKTCV